MEQPIIAGAVVLFVAFLLWNGLIRAPLRRTVREHMSPTPDGADDELGELLDHLREGAKTGPILQKLKKRVASLPEPSLKADYLAAAGDALSRTLSRRGTALRYFLKALKTDPANTLARQGMRELLLAQRRGFKLEQVYWKLLSELDFERDGCALVTTVWRELAEILERRRSGRVRAVAIRRMLDHLEDDEACRGSEPLDCLDE